MKIKKFHIKKKLRKYMFNIIKYYDYGYEIHDLKIFPPQFTQFHIL